MHIKLIKMQRSICDFRSSWQDLVLGKSLEHGTFAPLLVHELVQGSAFLVSVHILTITGVYNHTHKAVLTALFLVARGLNAAEGNPVGRQAHGLHRRQV